MVYMGSKNRIAKHLLPFLLENIKNNKQFYIEPFCGGANIIDKVNRYILDNNLPLKIIGCDKNRYLISLLDYLSNDGFIKYEFIERDEWYKNYLHPFKEGVLNLETWKIGYLGFTKTFSGKFMNSYCGMYKNRDRNYQLELHNNLMTQKQNLKGIEFKYCDYLNLEIKDNSIIYLDPPYKNTAKYTQGINHDELYQWCCYVKDNYKNIDIYLSEFQSLGDRFKEIWSKEIINNMSKSKKTMIERLYKFE